MKTSELRAFYKNGFVSAFHVVFARGADNGKDGWFLDCELKNGDKVRVHTARNDVKIYSTVDAVLSDCLHILSKKKEDGFKWAWHF
jgi:hypothetical protein